jgi:hypothetical protein
MKLTSDTPFDANAAANRAFHLKGNENTNAGPSVVWSFSDSIELPIIGAASKLLERS